MKRVAIALTAAVLLALAPQAAQAKGGSGSVSTYGVGPLRLNVSGPNAARRFAGNPDHVKFFDENGNPSNLRNSVWAEWSYAFPAHGYVDIWFWWSGTSWLFEQFDTSLERFHTVRGTRVGMTYAQARARERIAFSPGCVDEGFWRTRGHGLNGYYAYLVGINPGQRVHALRALGPYEPLC